MARKSTRKKPDTAGIPSSAPDAKTQDQWLRQQALQMANHPDHDATAIVAQAQSFYEFLKGTK